ncbi:MAG: ferric reductase-like transmembrane domain-containing protein [Opitutaceae bacterium]|nr:ferric reductase-like transmembrane domain-containing protein [Opitutaceae bacterium]
MNTLLARLLQSRAFVAACVVAPGLWPAWPLFVTGDSSVAADPAKYVLHHLGFTAACVLVAVLLLSPLRAILPRWRPVLVVQRHRRFVGVSAFVYAALHVAMHFVYEGGFATFRTDWQKPFILVGLVAFGILFILAATSLDRVVRALGSRRWKWLHRLVYVAAVLVLYHQISARKVFPEQVLWLFGPLVVAELARVGRAVVRGMGRDAGDRALGGGSGAY